MLSAALSRSSQALMPDPSYSSRRNMSTTVSGLSVDTTDSAELAGFWADVLGMTVNAGATSEYAAIESTPRLVFHRVPEGNEFDLIAG
jgi:hypothetical protein